MPNAKRKVYHAEIRDLDEHHSDETDASVTVLTDTLHAGGQSNLFEDYDAIRVYVLNTQDQTVDYQVEHSEPEDTDFTATIEEGTATTVNSNSVDTITFSGPLGRVRFEFHVTGTTAATSGSVKAVIIGV